jgi:rare lipoprotein A
MIRRDTLPALLLRSCGLLSSALLLAACSGAPKKATPSTAKTVSSPSTARSPAGAKKSPYAPAQEDPSKRGDYTRGGLYAPHIQDSAPGEIPDVDAIPEPEVRNEPRSRYGNRSPYVVLGKSYTVRDTPEGYVEQGLASFYGNKFHGRKTSNLEVYDMYAFTAAHKSLPLPSYARVTNLSNGKSIVVRVNDRGPFHAGRIVDLSYAAAVKLGVHRTGTARVEVRGLSPGENAREPYDAVAARAAEQAPTAATSPSALVLPPGVRIATGKPQPAPGSAIDKFVEALPILSAAAGERGSEAPTAAPVDVATSAASTSAVATTVPALASGQEWRFDMRQDGKAMTADEFDAWMKARRARVATGKPGKPDARPVAAVAASGAAAAMRAAPPPPPSSLPAATRPATVRPATNDGVTLQVAAFGARGNAERALSMLHGAGIDKARLQDGDSNGQKVWRLRVGPIDATTAAELTARVAGLGFGQPQLVRE